MDHLLMKRVVFSFYEPPSSANLQKIHSKAG